MTYIGKFLVLVLVALSLVLASVSLGIYTQRIDWSGTAGAGSGASKGEVAKIKEELTPSYAALADAEARFGTSATTLEDTQKIPARNQLAYDRMLKALNESNEATPVKDVEYDNGSLLKLDGAGLPKLIEAKDRRGDKMFGAQGYKDKIKELAANIERDTKAIGELKDQDLKLTTAIKKKLDEAASEEAKSLRIIEELEYLKPLWYNTLVDKDLVVERQRTLEIRKLELQKAKGLVNK